MFKIRKFIKRIDFLEMEFYTLFIILPSIFPILNLEKFLEKYIFIGILKPIYPMHKIILLQIIFLYTFFVYKKHYSFDSFKIEHLKNNLSYIKNILFRAIFIALGLYLFVSIFFEERLFLPLKKFPFVFLFLVFLFYPILSVIQQEFMFRIFFFERYKSLFSHQKELIIVNSLLFMLVHIIYENWIALLLTFFGNFLFVRTYLKTKSFYLLVLEHSLYGYLIFLSGLGEFFYRSYSLRI